MIRTQQKVIFFFNIEIQCCSKSKMLFPFFSYKTMVGVTGLAVATVLTGGAAGAAGAALGAGIGGGAATAGTAGAVGTAAGVAASTGAIAGAAATGTATGAAIGTVAGGTAAVGVGSSGVGLGKLVFIYVTASCSVLTL